jgi:ATP-dependent Zn protease
MENELDYKRGTACHEAGHAIVLHSFGVAVQCVHIEFDEVKSEWRGGADVIKQEAEQLHYMDQVAACLAGRVAERLFECPSYQGAWLCDLLKVHNTLAAVGTPDDELEQRIDEGWTKACKILEAKKDKALSLIALLFEKERVDGPEFHRFMACQRGLIS